MLDHSCFRASCSFKRTASQCPLSDAQMKNAQRAAKQRETLAAWHTTQGHLRNTRELSYARYRAAAVQARQIQLAGRLLHPAGYQLSGLGPRWASRPAAVLRSVARDVLVLFLKSRLAVCSLGRPIVVQVDRDSDHEQITAIRAQQMLHQGAAQQAASMSEQKTCRHVVGKDVRTGLTTASQLVHGEVHGQHRGSPAVPTQEAEACCGSRKQHLAVQRYQRQGMHALLTLRMPSLRHG